MSIKADIRKDLLSVTKIYNRLVRLTLITFIMKLI